MQDLFLSHRFNFIDDEEFLVLSDLFEWKNPCFPYEDYSPFNQDEMTESECLSEFRFRKIDIPILLVTAWRVFAWFEEVFGSVDQIMYLTITPVNHFFTVHKQHLFPLD